MTLKAEFEQCAEDIKTMKSRPTDKELGDLYGLYKQATIGDINFARPGFIELTAKAKWDAWNLRKGMSQEDAMNAYISVGKKILEKYGM